MRWSSATGNRKTAKCDNASVQHALERAKLFAFLPNVRITPRVKNSQNNNPACFRKKEHGVWKAADLNAANRAVLDRKPFWMIGRKLHCTLYLRCERGAKSDLPLFVPQRRNVKLGACCAAKDDPQGHLFKRAMMEE